MKVRPKTLHITLIILLVSLCIGAAVWFLLRDSSRNDVPAISNQDVGKNPTADLPASDNASADPETLLSEEPQDQTASPPLLTSPTDICDPAVTELQTHGDRQILTGGPVPIVYYRQDDERWGDLLYGSDPICSHGCGPTAMAMVVSSLTDTLIDPPSMARWAVAKGYWARHSGSYHSIVIGTAEAFGLHAESFTARDADSLVEALFSGKLLVALMGPGHFTQGGHFIILRGVTLSGEILVADPASEERSLTSWDARLILEELSSSTADGSPLWVISVPENPFPE